MKKNIRILTKTIFIFGIAVLFSNCSKFEQEPQGRWIDGEQQTSADSYESDVFTLYTKLRGSGITSGLPAFAINSFRSEDAEKGSTASDGAVHGEMFDNFEYTATNSLISTYWSSNYSVINLANNVITAINKEKEKKGKLEESDLINYSEAHFFRAFAYFNLVRAFGEVPLIDFKLNEAADANVPKAKVEEIYQLIDADLTIAEEHLPKKWDAAFIGRLTWGAARSLHARTYMMRNDWNNMYQASMDVINSGLYNLNTPYDKIFREEGENGSGSILELQCTATEAEPGSNNVGSQFAQVQGVRGSGDWNLGWGFNTPTQLLADAFEEGDPRKDETLLYFIKTGENPNSIKANQPWGEKPVANADVSNLYYNKKAYTNPSLRETYTRGGFWVNIRLIRYADVLLMASEAANELGKSAEALDYLEQVRARARKGATEDVLPKRTTANQSELRDFIRHERRVELGMEFGRFYDLVRWGIAEEVLHKAGKTNYQPKNALLPLPQDVVDKSNGVLKQNPNY